MTQPTEAEVSEAEVAAAAEALLGIRWTGTATEVARAALTAAARAKAQALQEISDNIVEKVRTRPDWNKIMADCGGAHPDDNERVIITRGTARLAASAIRASQEEAAYHNFNAAEGELLAVLAQPLWAKSEVAALRAEKSKVLADKKEHGWTPKDTAWHRAFGRLSGINYAIDLLVPTSTEPDLMPIYDSTEDQGEDVLGLRKGEE